MFPARSSSRGPATWRPIDPEQMTSLPPIRTVLQAGKKTAAADSIAVHLHARLTEIGTLELWCSEVARPANLEAAIRRPGGHAHRSDRARGTRRAGRHRRSSGLLDACRQLIRQTFGPPGDGERVKPESLIEAAGRGDRHAAHGLAAVAAARDCGRRCSKSKRGGKQSPQHEARWLSLLGFALRPGYGMAVDDWRVAQTRRLLGSLVFNTPTSRAEWWILWRRIAGGLPAGQQRALAQPPHRRNSQRPPRARPKGAARNRAAGSHEAAELWRLLGSLELLNIPDKIELGNMLLDMAPREKVSTVQSAAHLGAGPHRPHGRRSMARSTRSCPPKWPANGSSG